VSQSKSTAPKRRVAGAKPPEAVKSRSGTPGLSARKGASVKKAGTPPLSADRYCLIEQVAYFKAERRGFEPGWEVQDWLEAEAEVEAMTKNAAR
jgi:Protein of unknown function (DUF2934)